ncbi:MAG TPA: hypothetical protein VKO18_16915 [Terriglobia bacterium]|nr:hypothetical protein [Terriglobia bacterium]
MRKVHLLNFGLMVCLSFAVSIANGSQGAQSTNFPRVPQAVILSLTGKHYPGITRALSTVGFQVREVSAEAYESSRRGRSPLLIIPDTEGQQLDPTLSQTILHDVEGGTPLLLDGPTPLAGELGLKALGTRGQITRYRWDDYALDPVRLPGRLAYRRFKGNHALKVLAFDPRDKSPLVVSGSRGQGRFIYSAIALEPEEGMVFQYLPFLAQAIVDELHVAPTIAADNLCVYMDAGGEPKVDPAAVVVQLKSWSVREVHLGAFYGSESFREFIPRFIAAAHQEGITVYAWLEYPMVSTEFWIQHPPWREVTASGRPAIMDWRYHMALEDPACFAAVAELTRRLVLDYDWDGVDFAELYFEAEPGIFKHPEDFTPMYPTFRKMFRQRYGVDPLKMFDPESPQYGPLNPKLRSELQEYRVELITQLTEHFLETLANCQAQKPYLQTTLTFIDALRDPTVTERFGVDPDRLLALQKRFGFAVEIEDPYTVWNSSPDRYRAIGEHYRPRLLPGTPFSLDVNVVDRVPPGRPLNKPRGLELYELVSNVAASVDLITLYAFSTFSPDDMRLVPFVLGAQQMTGESPEEGRVLAQRQLIWRTDARGRTVYLDGQEWPCRSDSQVLIPAGEHSVLTRPQAESSGESALRIESLNGTILVAERSGHRVRLTYESRGRCYIRLNRTPATMLCDGAPDVGKILSNSGRVCLVLPQGKHTVEME